MIEIRIHGRGGQGGVTLAKILATAYHSLGKSVQAFGIYAAERSGAPLQAFLRFDDQPISNRNLIYEPDHVILLDPTLVSPLITSGLKPGGFILINTPESIETFSKQEQFRGYRLATVDATAIARKNKLGTQSVPIVNTALAGATSRLIDLDLSAVLKAFSEMGFHDGNVDAAKEAFENVSDSGQPQETTESQKPTLPTSRVPGPLTGNTGALPALRTGQWATEQPRQEEAVPPCNFICPAGNDVQGFLAALANDDVNGALEILNETTPLPAVCGRVCPGFCMKQCNRIEIDEAVNVRALERYVGDYGVAKVRPQAPRKERVAVVGSGPAGLSGAYQLARLGYQVTIFEAGDELGGLMRTGIPSYRLPREALEKDITRVLELGVKTVMNRRISQDDLTQLTQEYDAVLAATGLQNQRSVDLGLGNSTMMQGIEFLDAARQDQIQVQDEEVVVVGGGNTAVDAARSAFRLGAKKVKIVYRRTRAEMPAIEEEVDEAIDEGIEIHFLVSPSKITKEGDQHLLVCTRMELGEPDESGRRRPVEIPGSQFKIPCDRVILALGQMADLTLMPQGEVPTGTDGSLLAAGDLLTNEGTVTAAIGCGRDMALQLHERFSGEKVREERPDVSQVIRSDQIKAQHFPLSSQHHGKVIPITKRKESFSEVDQGLESAEEAKRCLSCGVCNHCDRCVTYCPDGVLKRVGGELVFDYDYCKGCGVCVSECSRAVIHMGVGK